MQIVPSTHSRILLSNEEEWILDRSGGIIIIIILTIRIKLLMVNSVSHFNVGLSHWWDTCQLQGKVSHVVFQKMKA